MLSHTLVLLSVVRYIFYDLRFNIIHQGDVAIKVSYSNVRE